jgi:hypothetical protein
LQENDIVEVSITKMKNGKPTIITLNGERFVKESPFKGKPTTNKPKGKSK